MSKVYKEDSENTKTHQNGVKFVCFKPSSSDFPSFSESQGNQSVKRRSKAKYTNMINLGKKRYCNCCKTQCDKNYCDCYANGESCDPIVCKCIGCLNKQNENIKNGNKFSCNCRKTGCAKGYCECFSSGRKCGFFCNCENCSNKEIKENNSFNFFMNNDNMRVIELGINKVIIDNYKLKFRWALKKKDKSDKH